MGRWEPVYKVKKSQHEGEERKGQEKEIKKEQKVEKKAVKQRDMEIVQLATSNSPRSDSISTLPLKEPSQKGALDRQNSLIDYKHPQRIHVHPLTYNGQSRTCHLCHLHGPIWFCLPCGFDVCHQCYSQAIFEERKREKEKKTPQLAIDLWFYIFQFFHVRELIRAETVCQEWRNNIRSTDSNDIWRKSYLAAGLPLPLEMITQVSSWRERTHYRLKIEQNWNNGICSRSKLLRHGTPVYTLATTGKLLASGGPEGILNLWYLDDTYSEGGRYLQTFRGHSMSVTSVAFHPSKGKIGKLIVSGSHDKQVKIWDAMTGLNLLTLKGHTHSVLSVAVTDTRIYTCSGDATINEWDFWTGACLRSYRGHKDQICAIHYFNNRLVSGSVDRTVREWDLTTGRQAQLLHGHTEPVTIVHCDKDNIYSGSLGGVIKLWDNDRCKSTIEGAHLGTISAIVSQGKRLITGSYDQTVKIWDSETGNERVCHVGNFGFITSLECREETLVVGDLNGDIRFFDHKIPLIG